MVKIEADKIDLSGLKIDRALLEIDRALLKIDRAGLKIDLRKRIFKALLQMRESRTLFFVRWSRPNGRASAPITNLLELTHPPVIGTPLQTPNPKP